MSTSQICPELCRLLACPITDEELAPYPGESLANLNTDIMRAKVKDIGGRLVKDKLDGGFINKSQSVVYPIRKDVPLLQAHLAICLDERVMQCESIGYPQNQLKMFSEIDFWHGICEVPTYSHSYRYIHLFQEIFHLPKNFFDDKRVIDVGCGPQGSLDSLENARLRVGVDPLAEGYLQFRNKSSPMQYICGVAERLPFRNESFDVVVSLNAIDHVDHIDPVISELSRIVTPGGHIVLFTEVHEIPTVCEPIPTSWRFAERFQGFRAVWRSEAEKDRWDTFYNHKDPSPRYGSLFTVLQKI